MVDALKSHGIIQTCDGPHMEKVISLATEGIRKVYCMYAIGMMITRKEAAFLQRNSIQFIDTDADACFKSVLHQILEIMKKTRSEFIRVVGDVQPQLVDLGLAIPMLIAEVSEDKKLVLSRGDEHRQKLALQGDVIFRKCERVLVTSNNRGNSYHSVLSLSGSGKKRHGSKPDAHELPSRVIEFRWNYHQQTPVRLFTLRFSTELLSGQFQEKTMVVGSFLRSIDPP